MTVRRGISKRSHEKIGDCEQCRNVFKGGGKRVILVDENDVTILKLFGGGGGVCWRAYFRVEGTLTMILFVPRFKMADLKGKL